MQKAYIGGKWVEASSAKTFEVSNPANNKIIDHVAFCGAADTTKAIQAAEKAFHLWRKTTSKERSKILRKFYELMIAHREELARLVTMEQGKTIHESRGEVDYAASFVEWFSEEAKRIYGDIIPNIKLGQRIFTFKEPVGVVAAITPWNFPVAMITRKIAPAIAAGCTVVVKPSEETPLTAFYLARLSEEAGLPAGVLNIVCGDAPEIGNTLTQSEIVKMLTFTGSTRVGKMLMAESSNTVKKVALELGGNAPFIVFDDANIDLAVKGLVFSKLRSGGQSCICVNRIFVHEQIFDQFSSAVIAALQKVKVGDGLDESVNLGPLINKAASDKIAHMIADATSKGAEILFQAKITNPTDAFCAPSVISNITDNSLLAREEIFGPVISMFKFKDEEDVLSRANSTRYGLASYFYTENRHRISRMTEGLEYGMIGVNDVTISSEMTSFGGVKESGIGREGGRSGVLEYLEDKSVVVS